MTVLTAQRVRQLLAYNPETGILTRLATTGGRKTGSVAGNTAKDGRIQIYVDGKNYRVHRVIWLLVTGHWPAFDVDHMDGDPSNNRWLNLRDVPHQINLQNRQTHTKNNSVKMLGVSMNKKRFSAALKVDGKRLHLGTFDTPEEAHAVYLAAKRKFHPGCTI